MDTRMLTIKEVAELTQLSVSHIYALVSKSEIPHFKIGSAVRFTENDIADWLRSKRVYTRYDCATRAKARSAIANL